MDQLRRPDRLFEPLRSPFLTRREPIVAGSVTADGEGRCLDRTATASPAPRQVRVRDLILPKRVWEILETGSERWESILPQ